MKKKNIILVVAKTYTWILLVCGVFQLLVAVGGESIEFFGGTNEPKTMFSRLLVASSSATNLFVWSIISMLIVKYFTRHVDLKNVFYKMSYLFLASFCLDVIFMLGYPFCKFPSANWDAIAFPVFTGDWNKYVYGLYSFVLKIVEFYGTFLMPRTSGILSLLLAFFFFELHKRNSQKVIDRA